MSNDLMGNEILTSKTYYCEYNKNLITEARYDNRRANVHTPLRNETSNGSLSMVLRKSDHLKSTNIKTLKQTQRDQCNFTATSKTMKMRKRIIHEKVKDKKCSQIKDPMAVKFNSKLRRKSI